MNILFLWGNPIAKELGQWLKEQGNNVIAASDTVSVEDIITYDIELVVSYTYRYILKRDIIDAVNGNIVNLHISYLPWNRGANPNQWSWIENTPKGISIHYIDEKVDNGDIIAQKLVKMNESITLKASYELLNQEIVNLFKEVYTVYPFWQEMRKKAVGTGSYHTVNDFKKYSEIINGNYDMPINLFREKIEKYEKEQRSHKQL